LLRALHQVGGEIDFARSAEGASLYRIRFNVGTSAQAPDRPPRRTPARAAPRCAAG
jgi:hypothetical protein